MVELTGENVFMIRNVLSWRIRLHKELVFIWPFGKRMLRVYSTASFQGQGVLRRRELG